MMRQKVQSTWKDIKDTKKEPRQPVKRKKGTKEHAATDDEAAEFVGAPSAMKPEIVVFRIVGMTPLLQNNPENFIGKTEESALGTKKVYNDDDEAALRVYRAADGCFGHPCVAFTKAMLRAVTGKKFGKVVATSAIKGAVFVTEPLAVIEDAKGKPMKSYAVDRRPCVVGKARVLRCRPVWNGWTMRVPLEIDTAILTPKQVEESLSLAGRIVGVGDYRPEKGGGFGRFSVKIAK